MKRMAMFLLLAVPTAVMCQGAPNQPSPIVFLDIAGPDLSAQKKFYVDLFAWQISDDYQMKVPIAGPISAALRMDPVEKRIYIGVTDVAKKLEEIRAHGGTIDVPRFVVPGVAILGLFKDPAGNPMGLVEMADGKPKIP